MLRIPWWRAKGGRRMATWSDLGLVAVGGGIGSVSSYVTIRLQLVHTAVERRRDKRDASIERLAQVLGPITTLLHDLYPDRVLINSGPDTGEQLKRYNERWMGLRDELAVVAAIEPLPEVRAAMAKLDVEVNNLLNRLGWIVNGEKHDLLEEAERHHAEAERLISEILNSVREAEA
jgi:hypothetical protein